MGVFESMIMAVHSLAGNRMRSALTMLGVVIGVAAVIAMVAIGQGANSQVTSSIQSLGTNLLMISPGQATQGGVRMGAGSLTTLKTDDADALKKLPGVSGVASEVSVNGNVVFKDQNTQTSIIGTTPEYSTARNTPADWGRFINEEDVRAARKVAVLGTTVLDSLGVQAMSVLGQRILINHVPFTVVGILRTKGSTGPFNQDDQIIIPVSTAMLRFTGSKSVRQIDVAVEKNADMDMVTASIEDVLRRRHRLASDVASDFNIRSQAEILNTLSSITGVFTILLGGIASISLLVGGIGIMNIMLVSVTERTKEIGIRKALGAKRKHILNQFMIESVVLSGFGGIVGVIVGIAISYGVKAGVGFQTVISTNAIFLAFGFSLVIGVFFGVYPAMKASRLHPIDALHYE